MHTYVHTYVHTYIHTRTHTYICVCMYNALAYCHTAYLQESSVQYHDVPHNKLQSTDYKIKHALCIPGHCHMHIQ